jgi:hypothetical protein
MEHARIVAEDELENYADQRSSEDTIPELLSLLVRASVPTPDLSDCRIPYGNAIRQSGWDAIVKTENGLPPFVPAGSSYWEFGCGADPQDKATREFKKRTAGLSTDERASSTFVFLTPRSGGSEGWPIEKQQAWINRRKSKGWKDVRVLDGTRLADWLREFPSIAKWLRKRMGLSLDEGSLTTPKEYWQTLSNWSSGVDPPFQPNVFLRTREAACAELRDLFNREVNVLQIQYEDPDDVGDFVSAYLESLEEPEKSLLSSQCLFIRDREAWNALSNLRRSHFLVAHPKVDLEWELAQLVQARNRGHYVIVPTQSSSSNVSSRTTRIPSPSRHDLEEALKTSGFSLQRAREISQAAGNSLVRMKRYVLGMPGPPDYAAGPHARELAQSLLIGRWDGTNEADKSVIEKFLGKSYGEWIGAIRTEVIRPNAPLTQRDEKYKFIARQEAWQLLLAHVFDDDLDAFREMALEVLGETDPALELPPDDRFSASIYGKTARYSAALKSGLAETLAMLGAKPESLTSCSIHKAESMAARVVGELLEEKDWKEWATLNSYLPLMAEASPFTFLDAVNSAMESEPSPYIELFAQESAGITGRNYLTGLLWALETLAWDAKLLSRVTIILGSLAHLDPGGNWANRPSNSLSTIYLPWYPQTTATREQCLSAVRALCEELPAVGWQLLFSLISSDSAVTTGSRLPVWRDYIPTSYNERPTHREYVEQVTAYARLATDIAQNDLVKLQQIVDQIGNLPVETEAATLTYLASDEMRLLPEEDRLPLWESLIDLVHRHRQYADAQWALPTDTVKRIESIAEALKPQDILLRHRRLFTDGDFDLYEGDGDWAAKQSRLVEKRANAVKELLSAGGLNKVLEFAKSVTKPGLVGSGLAIATGNSLDSNILPDLLGDSEEPHATLARGFIWGRFQHEKWPWVHSIDFSDWTTDQVASFFAVLPFELQSWHRAEELLKEDAAAYWKRTWANPHSASPNVLEAAERLMRYNRPDAAVDCLAYLVREKQDFDPKLAINAIESYLVAPLPKGQRDHYDLLEILVWLQGQSLADRAQIGQLEWVLIPLLDGHHGATPVVLEEQLRNRPEFFCELIQLLFRSDSEDEKQAEITEHQRAISQSAYRLLHEWRSPPGTNTDGVVDDGAANDWLAKVEAICTESGHLRIAMSQLGHVLAYAPADSGGLWIHRTYAQWLNARDADSMRTGFRIECYNSRGVHGWSAGKEELEIASSYNAKADELEAAGFVRFAKTLRELAETYKHESEYQAARDPYAD